MAAVLTVESGFRERSAAGSAADEGAGRFNGHTSCLLARRQTTACHSIPQFLPAAGPFSAVLARPGLSPLHPSVTGFAKEATDSGTRWEAAACNRRPAGGLHGGIRCPSGLVSSILQQQRAGRAGAKTA